MANLVYITHTGMAEPLGQSQVLGYLKPLAAQNAIHLISFEKADDFADMAKMAAVQSQCDAVGIIWTRHRFRTAPRYISSILNVGILLASTLQARRKSRATIIHARSYLPSLVARIVCAVAPAKYVFDMRALWPEELIGAGRVRRGSLIHKCLDWVEKTCLRNAAAVVSLTHAAVTHLKHTYPETVNTQFHVIPTCVDLDRFTMDTTLRDGLVFGCSGTVISGFFRLDLLARVFAQAALKHPAAQFQVITKDDADIVRAKLVDAGVPTERLTIRPSPPQDMPTVHADHSASVMFFTTNTGKLGSCPTRMGEALACGTPVIINPGIGDVAQIAATMQGTILLRGESDSDIAAALDEFDDVLQTNDLAKQCRATAQKVFSLDAGVAEYQRVYDALS